MKPSEIIIQDSEKRNLDPKVVLFGVNYIIKKGGLILSQDKSVLVLQRISKKAFACHLFTIDSPIGLSKSLLMFLSQMQNKGINELYGKADNQEIIGLIKHLATSKGVEVKNSDLPQYNWMIEL